nr:sugar nucleotide-binding protein [Candidatus Gracilibacteria bacterium]
MKILLLGKNGNLGSQILKSSPFPLIAYGQSDLDLTNQAKTQNALNEIKPEIIINTVAYNAVDACENNELEQEKAL